jgi:hypothetical protein
MRSIARPVRRAQRNLKARRIFALEHLEERSLLSAVPTLTTLSASANSIFFSQSLTLAATVIAAPGNTGTPASGSVTFMDGGTPLGPPVALNSAGKATLQTTALPVGVQVLTASYSGSYGIGPGFAGSRTVVGPNSIITTVAGNGTNGYSGDNGQATAAGLNLPEHVAVDAAGDLFIADFWNNRIREVDHTTGLITTVAGNGMSGAIGDNVPATAANVTRPVAIAVDAAGDLFITGNLDVVQEVNHATGVITTIAGTGAVGDSGDGGQATAAELDGPQEIAVDAAGDVFLAEARRVREVNHATGVITTVAGNGTFGYSGDGGQATAAELDGSVGVAVDAAGDIFIADAGNNVVREVNHSTGVITTIAGNGTKGYSGDQGPAVAAELDNPTDVAVDAAGNVFIADDYNACIREVSHATGVITTVAGNGTGGFSGDNGQATAAELYYPVGIAVDTAGDLFIAATGDDRIREVASGATVVTVQPDETTPGVFNPANSTFCLDALWSSGPAFATVPYGPAGSNWTALCGDWNGDGVSTLGLYNPATGTFYLKNSNSAGPADTTFNFGPGGQDLLPIVGDWDGNNTMTVGLYYPATGTFYLKNSNSAGAADLTFQFGPAGQGWLPVAGDWDGNGTTTVGLYNPATGTFFLKNTNSAGPADLTFNFGPGGQGCKPLAGVWNDSYTTVGLYNSATGTFYLKNSNSAGPADMTFNYGPGGKSYTPLMGSWLPTMVCEPAGVLAGTGATSALVNADATGLTAADLEPLVQQAIARWAAAGASSAALAQMANTQVVLGNLPAGELAQESPGQIVINRTAAGYGSLLDSAPGEAQQYAAATTGAPLPYVDPQAVDQIDLLTVVEQELGTVAGLPDSMLTT